jgi:phosphatidylglycerophosphate synthase
MANPPPVVTPPGPGKPPEVEEWVDDRFHRPIARPLVSLLVHTPITPNQVTLVSCLLGLAAGVAMVLGTERPQWMLVAAGLLFLSVIFDCADGQLARAKRISSTYGAVLDGIGDYVVGVSVAIGGTWFMVGTHGSSWYLLVGVAGTASLAVKSALFDNTKTRYLARIRTGYAEREEDLDAIERERQRAWGERRWRDALLLWTYLQYTRAQQRAMAVPPAPDPVAFRAAFQGRMRAWTWMGSGTHFALAYLAVAASVVWPWAIAAYMMFHVTLVNLALILLVRATRDAWA